MIILRSCTFTIINAISTTMFIKFTIVANISILSFFIYFFTFIRFCINSTENKEDLNPLEER